MSKRKPHNDEAGYVAEKIFRPTGAHVVIYLAESQGIDVDGNRYAVVCSKHSTICGVSSVPKARVLLKYPEFCERCMAEKSEAMANSQLIASAPTLLAQREELRAALQAWETHFTLTCDRDGKVSGIIGQLLTQSRAALNNTKD